MVEHKNKRIISISVCFRFFFPFFFYLLLPSRTLMFRERYGLKWQSLCFVSFEQKKKKEEMKKTTTNWMLDYNYDDVERTFILFNRSVASFIYFFSSFEKLLFDFGRLWCWWWWKKEKKKKLKKNRRIEEEIIKTYKYGHIHMVMTIGEKCIFSFFFFVEEEKKPVLVFISLSRLHDEIVCCFFFLFFIFMVALVFHLVIVCTFYYLMLFRQWIDCVWSDATTAKELKNKMKTLIFTLQRSS